MTSVERADPPQADTEILAAATAVISARLPATWTITTTAMKFPDARGRGRADALLTLSGPTGAAIEVVVDVKNQFHPREIARIRDRLATVVAERPGSVPALVARYLSGPTRQHLAEAGLSYADATGNLLLRADDPVIYLADRGADRDPWRGAGRPQATLTGEPAARIVRALADLPGPWRTRELAAVSGASTGSVYRVLGFLDNEGLATRDDNGAVAVTDWAALLKRWSRDYGFLATNTVTRYIAPRGLAALLDRIRATDFDDYAITGSVAAAAWSQYAPARSAMVYAPDPARAAKQWGLRPTDTGVNVLIASPAYPVVLERTTAGLDGLRLAAPTQVAVDLMTGPGRAPAEADELLSWMGQNERSWR
ncbi:helix-turn-helix domain-containing protein [Nocardia carnea]|uniref:helix-turn-helix domain-containing protein n=1 Tax=Nocardia carnea TaxID=37328 RepID=UPI002458237A|nr:helix-turn-helix domain-containing protein [Nocardia carnea]